MRHSSDLIASLGVAVLVCIVMKYQGYRGIEGVEKDGGMDVGCMME